MTLLFTTTRPHMHTTAAIPRTCNPVQRSSEGRNQGKEKGRGVLKANCQHIQGVGQCIQHEGGRAGTSPRQRRKQGSNTDVGHFAQCREQPAPMSANVVQGGCVWWRWWWWGGGVCATHVSRCEGRVLNTSQGPPILHTRMRTTPFTKS